VIGVAARPLMLSPCLVSSPTGMYDVTSDYKYHQQQPMTSSPVTSLVGDSSAARPWPTSPTDHHAAGLFQLDTSSWVRGSAESLVGQVRVIFIR